MFDRTKRFEAKGNASGVWLPGDTAINGRLEGATERHDGTGGSGKQRRRGREGDYKTWRAAAAGG